MQGHTVICPLLTGMSWTVEVPQAVSSSQHRCAAFMSCSLQNHLCTRCCRRAQGEDESRQLITFNRRSITGAKLRPVAHSSCHLWICPQFLHAAVVLCPPPPSWRLLRHHHHQCLDLIGRINRQTPLNQKISPYSLEHQRLSDKTSFHVICCNKQRSELHPLVSFN